MRKLLSLFFATTSCIAIFAQEETLQTDSEKQTSIFSGNCIDHPVLNDVYIFNDQVFIGKRKASNKQIFNLMRIASPELYEMRSTGKSLMVGGVVLTSTGGGLLLVGGFCIFLSHIGEWVDYEDSYNSYNHRDSDLWKTGIILVQAGAAGVAAGTPLIIIGAKKKKQAIRDFKQNCLSEEFFDLENQHSYRLNLNVNQNGVGLALVF